MCGFRFGSQVGWWGNTSL